MNTNTFLEGHSQTALTKAALLEFHKEWAEFLVALLIILLCVVLKVITDRCFEWLRDKYFKRSFDSGSDRGLDPKSKECLNAAEICVKEGNYVRSVGLLRKRVLDLKNADAAQRLLDVALSRKRLRFVHKEIQSIKVDLYENLQD